MQSEWNKHPFVNNAPRKCLDNIHKTNTYGHRLYKLKQRLQRGEISLTQYQELARSLRGMMNEGTLKFAQKLVEDKREKEYLILSGQCQDEEIINSVFPNMLNKNEPEEASKETHLEHINPNITNEESSNESRYEIIERIYRGIDATEQSMQEQTNAPTHDHDHSSADDSTHDSMHGSLYDSTHDSTHGSTRDSMHGATRDLMRDSSHDATHGSTRDSMRDSSHDATHGSTHGSINDSNHDSMCNSSHNSTPQSAMDDTSSTTPSDHIDPEIMKLLTS